MAALRSPTARALDAADGVIDGKYFGRPIIETSGLGGLSGSVTRRYGGYSGGYYSSPLRRYDYGSRVVTRAPYVSTTAAALDAPILETGYPVTRSVYPYPASASVTRYGGRYPAYSSPASVTRYGGRYPTYTSPASVTRYTGYPAYTSGAVTRYPAAEAVTTRYPAPEAVTTRYPAPEAVTTRYPAAEAVTRYGAADAVTRYGGADAVTRYGGAVPRYPVTASVTRVGPRRYYDDFNVSYGGRYIDGYRPASVTRYGYYDDVAYPRRYVDDAYTAGYSRPAYRSSTALALDAADGVIDGKYFGRPIVEAPVTRAVTRYGGYPYGGLAERLDAADGVIDGRYFGRRIVNV